MRERYFLAGGTKPVPYVSVAGDKFAEEESRILDFMTHQSDGWINKMEVMLKARVGGEGPAKEADTQFLAHYREQRLLVREMVLCRVADNFLTFVSDLLAEIYKHRPEMLRSGDQERLEFILQFHDMEELRGAIAEKKVERLSYLGLPELAENIEKQMGFELFPISEDLKTAALIVELRNIYVHNRGVVSARSGRRYAVLSEHVGMRVLLTHDVLNEHRHFLENAAVDIDVRAVQKFGLPCRSLPESEQRAIAARQASEAESSK